MTNHDRDWMIDAYCRGKGGMYDSDNRGGGQEKLAQAICAPCKEWVNCAKYHVKHPPAGVIACGRPFPENKSSSGHHEMMIELREIASGDE